MYELCRFLNDFPVHYKIILKCCINALSSTKKLYFVFLQVQASLSRVAQRKVVQRSRAETADLEEPNEAFDNISERFRKTIDGEAFLQGNIESPGGRILIFTTTKSLCLLSEAPIWLMDGTFCTAPQGFCQIFTIHAGIGDGDLRRFLPLVYMLLPKKDEATYMAAFEELCEIASRSEIELEPTLLMTDFELAQINAAKKTFETAAMHGCYFHLCQNMYKKIQQLGFQTIYGNSYRVQLLFKQLTSLAFLPAAEIPRAFDELRKNSSNMLPAFFDYMSDYYIHGKQLKKKRRAAIFPPALWSVHENVLKNIPRTSNNLEGWHCKWNGLLKAGNPPFYSVVTQFQNEERSVNAELLRMLQGEQPKKRSKKSVVLDEKLRQVVTNYDRTKNLDFLTGVALIFMNSS